MIKVYWVKNVTTTGIRDNRCNELSYFLCEANPQDLQNATNNMIPKIQHHIPCTHKPEAGWIQSPLDVKACYYIGNNATGMKDWNAARDYCHKEGAELVTIDNDEEMRVIDLIAQVNFNVSLAALVSSTHELWTGMTRHHQGYNKTDFSFSWKWVSGTPLTYLNWHTGYPANNRYG